MASPPTKAVVSPQWDGSTPSAKINPKIPKTAPKIAENHAPDPDTREIDSLFELAGLTRSRRNKPAGVKRRARYQPLAPEEIRPARPITRQAPNGVEWIGVKAWDRLPWLWHGFSTRRGGLSRAYSAEEAPAELNLGFTPDDDRENVVANRHLLVEAVTGDAAIPLITLRQIHSSVLVLGAQVSTDRTTPCKGDGLMTDRPGLLLGIQTADCIPVLVADRKRRVVTAFHAGWRGTVKRIVESGIGRMRLEFGSRPEDLVAAIGPGVGPCCYAVGEEVVSEFTSQFSYGGELFREVYDTDPVRTRYPMLFLTQRAPGHSPIGPAPHLDLIEANRRQLLASGVKPAAIHVTGGCTSCHGDLFFSHRSSRGHCGRMMSVIGISGD